MLVPGAPTWCAVKNFFRADDETVFPDMVRLTVRALDGSANTTTVVSWVHIMHIITDTAPRTHAATPDELGAFVNEIAMNTKAGQLVAMPTTPGLKSTFKLGVIERVEIIEEAGKYVPAIEHPFIWADGLMQPIWAAWFQPLAEDKLQFTFPVDMYAANAFRHMLGAPLWMNNMQPKGTPGRLAKWDGHHRAPLLEALTAALNGPSGAPVSTAANFTAVQEWFAPRYLAWKADPSKVITEADVLAVLPSAFAHTAASSSCPMAAAAAGASRNVFSSLCHTPCGLRPVTTSV